MENTLLFNLQIDCESTQQSISDPGLGERAIRGLAEAFEQTGTLGTFLVIPGDIEAHAAIYRELESAGHEVGLHLHPIELGYTEFMGVMGPDQQRAALGEAIDRFSQAMGRRPLAFCPGYASANDYTFGILEDLALTHGMVSLPTRDLPQVAAMWGASPLDPRYPHRYHRSLCGDVNFVDLPLTVDPESRMWGGGHPLDLRVEIVDAKNHWFTMDKAVKRQIEQDAPLRQLHALTHNVFEFGEADNFRRQTYLGMVAGAKQIAEREGLVFKAATLADIATAYRAVVPLAAAASSEPALDTRGRAFQTQ